MIFLRFAWPYLLVALLGAAADAGVEHLIGTRQLADERAARSTEAQQHANDLATISQAVLAAEQRATAAHDTAASQVAAIDAQLTKERTDHESENRNYRAAVASGDQRLRVAVRNCTATGADGLSGTTGSSGVRDGATASAGLDPAVVERVFGVVGDDQLEIDKLKAMQEYVCVIRCN
ncbi:lysis system i-spanin subunit Rz [Burkholderia cepacia]|uniref:Lysozyme n=1 Tax=Burkholderia cepacia TaxID=292 RepID=A0A104ATT5_BURCE|nr:lysis system i-spanin subunit Rz [Burkholderia cepacia]KVK86023.1 lysozyme [Burkholderia cepacia]KVL04354.1 lysozyme [Burkholderia cepacia]